MPFKFVGIAAVAIISVGCCIILGCSGANSKPWPEVDVDRVKLRAESDAPFTTTESGLKFRMHRDGDGNAANRSNKVFVHYRGWLDDGTEFDSSYKRGEPASFFVSGVVPGFAEGLQLVTKGGIIELEIPPALGYGPEGGGPIPQTRHCISTSSCST